MAATDRGVEFVKPAIDRLGRQIIAANMAITGLVFLLMILFGLLMRLAQSGWIEMGPGPFYEYMTIHGAGMVGMAALGGITVMWYFLSRYVRLSSGILAANLLFFLVGVAMILWSTLVGGYGGAWTFLYPLPAKSAGVWSAMAAFWFLFGLLLVGVGFLLVCLDFARSLILHYGGISRALGWPQLFGFNRDPLPPPIVTAAGMVTVVTTAALLGGATILLLSIVNLFAPDFIFDPLFAKNIIYFFGHTFINATIYMGVAAVYELLPVYTGRPWQSSKAFVAAWLGSTIMVLVIFPHHLLMDFAMPKWTMILAQILSYTNSFPVLIVTGYGALTIIHRSGIRWDVVSSLLLLSMFGWMAGVVPAVIDATIVVNSVMHNTLWVPGHFHFYLLLGLLPMLLAFMYYLTHERGLRVAATSSDGIAFRAYLVGGLGFVLMFLYAGRQGVPRRWATHNLAPEWMTYDRIASLFAILVLLAATFFVFRTIFRLPRYVAGEYVAGE